MGLRHRSIRLRVGILIVVPVLCLIGLYGFAASISLGSALTQARAKTLATNLLTPVSTFQQQLAQERHLAMLNLASPMNTHVASELGMQEAATFKALTVLKAAVASQMAGNASPGEQAAILTLLRQTGKLTYIRSDVNADAISMTAALNDYDAIENAAYAVLDEATDSQASVPLVTQALDVINLGRALQATLEESDLLAADMMQLKFPTADRIAFAELANERQTLINSTVPGLLPEYHNLLMANLTPSISSSLDTLEAEVIRTPWRKGPPTAQLVAGTAAFGTYAKALETARSSASARLQAQAQHQANTVFLQLILAAGLGLLGTIASIVLSLVIGRGLVRQLRDLRESALVLAHEKLPSVISQLRAGEPVDVAEYEPGQVPTSDEIEQVQHAFRVVQQSAIQSAVDEARLRRGISDVFRNLAGRSQSLLHRQLTLLDGMERRATEPDELEDLFRIDHLTTRMRRHAEGLIILSGETPARGWRQPVPLVDVLRAAVAEVEDYTRIRVLCRTGAAVAGHAVADVIHLIAELAENATVFSPPNTPVRIQGDVVGRGFAVEVEDRGLGISQARLDEINANLASPPQFDLSGSDRLGLFIAGQLAQRHDIKITLRPSVYGGTTAIVLIPTAVVVEEDTFERDPALPAGRDDGRQRDRISGRHAALTHAVGRPGNGNGRSGAEQEPDYAGFNLALPGRSAAESEPPVLTPAVSDDQDGRVSTAELAELGLPVRVRQASLAPQLRDSEPAVTPLVPGSGNGSSGPASFAGQPFGGEPFGGQSFGAQLGQTADGRSVPADSAAATPFTAAPPAAPAASPEAARNTMSALQRGWQLGRAEAGSVFDRRTDATQVSSAAGPAEFDPADGSDVRDNE